MPTQIDRLLELLDQEDLRVRRAFLTYVKTVKSPAVMDQLVRLLESNDLEGALRIVDSHIATFGNVIPDVVRSVGIATAAELDEQLPEVLMAIGFDPTNPRAARIAAEARMDLIQQLTEQQRLAIRQAVSRAVGEGLGVPGMARAFRDAIGLTYQQEAYVASFREQLEGRDRRVLDRALRDRRFDDRLRTALDRDRPLTQRQIDVMTDRYRARALIARSEVIGRTEALTAYSLAREESLQQMLGQTGIDQTRVVRIWHSTHDDRVRDWHATMEGQERPIGEPFVDGHGNEVRYPGDPLSAAETRINCRCTLGFEVSPAR